MGVNITRASREWATRPDDERFESVGALLDAVIAAENASFEGEPVARRSVLWDGNGHGLTINGAQPTNWSFGQACRLVGASSDTISKLSTPTAVTAMRELTAQADEGAMLVPYMRGGGPDGPLLRAMTSPDYVRLGDVRIVNGLARLEERGWVLPPDWSGRSSGAFYGDRNLFVVMIDDASKSIVQNPQAMRHRASEELGRFVIVSNSMVGNMSFRITLGWMAYICGNLIIWDATGVVEYRLRHVGDVLQKARQMFGTAIGMARDKTLSAATLSAFERSMRERIDEDDLLPAWSDECETKLAALVARESDLSPARARAAIEAADGQGLDPRTRWGIVQGVTALARVEPNADARVELSRAASVLMPRPRKALTAAAVTV